jgi:hypothetical protein
MPKPKGSAIPPVPKDPRPGRSTSASTGKGPVSPAVLRVRQGPAAAHKGPGK